MYKKESMWGKTDKKALLEAVRNVVVQEKMSTIAMRYEVTRLDCFTFQLIIQSDALGDPILIDWIQGKIVDTYM